MNGTRRTVVDFRSLCKISQAASPGGSPTSPVALWPGLKCVCVSVCMKEPQLQPCVHEEKDLSRVVSSICKAGVLLSRERLRSHVVLAVLLMHPALRRHPNSKV